MSSSSLLFQFLAIVPNNWLNNLCYQPLFSGRVAFQRVGLFLFTFLSLLFQVLKISYEQIPTLNLQDLIFTD